MKNLIKKIFEKNDSKIFNNLIRELNCKDAEIENLKKRIKYLEHETYKKRLFEEYTK